eukprot:scaffold699_cov385-Prasinococcus_capsulatus_cf.AAC.15
MPDHVLFVSPSSTFFKQCVAVRAKKRLPYTPGRHSWHRTNPTRRCAHMEHTCGSGIIEPLQTEPPRLSFMTPLFSICHVSPSGQLMSTLQSSEPQIPFSSSSNRRQNSL